MLDSVVWEWFGVITALIYVALASAGKRLCFVFGLISSLVFVDILFSAKLYFESIINIYYVVMSIIGWFTWKEDDGHVHPVLMRNSRFILIAGIGILASLVLGYFASSFTDASLSYLDSFTTVMAIIATWMMVRKVIQNWLIWIVADGVSIGMFYYKDLIPMSILFGVYTLIAVYGFVNWKKLMTTS